MCTSAHRTGASRRSVEAKRNRVIGLGRPRVSAACSLHREERTWKLGCRRRRLPGGQNRMTDFPTW